MLPMDFTIATRLNFRVDTVAESVPPLMITTTKNRLYFKRQTNLLVRRDRNGHVCWNTPVPYFDVDEI